MAGITAPALTTGLIATCRPIPVNRPFAWAMYRPALASAGTTATTRSRFSGPFAPAVPAGPPWPVQAAAATAIPAIVTAAKPRRHDRRPWPAGTAVLGRARPARPARTAATQLLPGAPQPVPKPGCVALKDLRGMPESSADAVTAAAAVTGCVAFPAQPGRATGESRGGARAARSWRGSRASFADAAGTTEMPPGKVSRW